MAVELGAGYVSLTVEARNVARDIVNQIAGPVERAMSAVGRDAGRKFSDQFADETRSGLGSINLGSNLDEGFGRLGTNAGNDFARQFNQETRNLGDNTSNAFITHTRGIGDHGATSGGHFARTFAASTIFSFGRLATQLGVILAVGVGAGVGLIVGSGIVKESVDMASGINEALSKVNVVFGESAAEIIEWSKTSATALGQSQLEALEAAGTFGNLFRAMGITTDASREMSKRTIELATDLASFNNANPEDVLIALKAGLVGETEPLRAFGVNLNDARIKAEAFRLGLVEAQVDQLAFSRAQETADKAARKMAETLTKNGEGSVEYADAVRDAEQANDKLSEVMDGKIPDSLTAAQKAQAAYSLILADTSLAQGDFAKTSGGLANQQRILSAEFDNLKVKIGTALLPGALRLVVALRTHVLPALERFAVVFEKDIIPAMGTATQWIKANVFPVFTRIGQILRDDVAPALVEFGGWINTNVVPVLVRIGQVLRDDVGPALARFGEWVRTVAIPAIQEFVAWLGPRLQPVIDAVRDGVEKIAPKFAELALVIRRDVLPPLRELWERFKRDIWPVLKEVADRILTEVLPAVVGLYLLFQGFVFDAVMKVVRGFGFLLEIMVRAWDEFRTGVEAVRTFVNFAQTQLDAFITFLLEIPGKVSGKLSGMWDGMKEAFRAMLNEIIGWWNALEFDVPSIGIGRAKVGGQTVGTPDIEELATGGVITRPTLAMVGETARATPEIVAPQRMMAETFRDELRRFSPMSNMAPVRIEHFHSTEPSRTVLEEMQWRIATGVL